MFRWVKREISFSTETVEKKIIWRERRFISLSFLVNLSLKSLIFAKLDQLSSCFLSIGLDHGGLYRFRLMIEMRVFKNFGDKSI